MAAFRGQKLLLLNAVLVDSVQKRTSGAGWNRRWGGANRGNADIRRSEEFTWLIGLTQLIGLNGLNRRLGLATALQEIAVTVRACRPSPRTGRISKHALKLFECIGVRTATHETDPSPRPSPLRKCRRFGVSVRGGAIGGTARSRESWGARTTGVGSGVKAALVLLNALVLVGAGLHAQAAGCASAPGGLVGWWP